MSAAGIDFEAADLAARVEALTERERDALPFGVVRLGPEGIVIFYSATEAYQSGYGRSPVGENFFEISRCLNTDEFRGRIARAIEAGPVDLEIGWKGDFTDPSRDLRMRVQSARDGGVWIFVERDPLRSRPQAASRN